MRKSEEIGMIEWHLRYKSSEDSISKFPQIPFEDFEQLLRAHSDRETIFMNDFAQSCAFLEEIVGRRGIAPVNALTTFWPGFITLSGVAWGLWAGRHWMLLLIPATLLGMFLSSPYIVKKLNPVLYLFGVGALYFSVTSHHDLALVCLMVFVSWALCRLARAYVAKRVMDLALSSEKIFCYLFKTNALSLVLAGKYIRPSAAVEKTE